MNKILITPVLLISILFFSCNTEFKTEIETDIKIKAKSNSESTLPGFAVVELFSSESCFDCPPAEEALNKFIGELKSSGKNVIVISENVDMWDELLYGEGECHGTWKDPFSKGAHTVRHFAYGKKLGEGPATPQAIFNGGKSVVDPKLEDYHHFSDSLLILEAAYQVSINLNDELTDIKNNKLVISFGVEQLAENTPEFRKSVMPNLYVYLLESKLESEVDKAENCGKTLYHDHIARTFNNKTLRFNLNGDVELYFEKDINLENCTVVAFVQNLLTLDIIGGTNGFDIVKTN